MSGQPPGYGRGGGRGSGHRGGYNQGHGNLSHRPQGGAQGGQRGRGQQYENRSGGRYQGNNQRGGRGGAISNFNIATHTAAKDLPLSQRETDLLKTNALAKTIEYPLRPAFGTEGVKLNVATNYFCMNVGIDSVMSYNFKIEKVKVAEDDETDKKEKVAKSDDQTRRGNTGGVKGPGKEMTRRVIQVLIEDHLVPNSIHAASDFASTLITSKKLFKSIFTITYRPDGETQPDDNAPVFRVTFNEGSNLNISELVKRMTSGASALKLNETTELLQALNIIIGYGSRTHHDIMTAGRNTYVAKDTTDKVDLIPALEAMHAFVFSARAATERVLINVQVRNLPFVMDLRLTDMVDDHFTTRSQPSNLEALAQLLRHVSIRVDHIHRHGKSGNPIYRYKSINGLARRSDGRQTPHPPRVARDYAGPTDVHFWKQQTGTYISVAEHFRTVHGRNVDAKYPVVNVGSAKEPSYLPMEVCIVRSGQIAKNKITGKQTSKMINFAVRQPAANAESIFEVGLGLVQLQRDDLTEFKLSIKRQLLSVPARQLPPPKVVVGKSAVATVINSKWTLEDQHVHRGVSNKTFSCLCITNYEKVWTGPDHLDRRLASFQRHLADIGVNIQRADQDPIANFKCTVYNQTNRKVIYDQIEKLLKAEPNFILVILGKDVSTEFYNAVKVMCDQELGVICQCIKADKFVDESRNEGLQYDVNVGLKINLKLGGSNQAINSAHFTNINISQTMFVGLDVTHPSPGSTSAAPSVASIVSSVNATLAQWPAAIRSQRAREEIIQGLTELVKGQVQLWSSHNGGAKPRNIIVYRDGVSEGQYKLVLENELVAIRAAIDSLYSPEHKPKLSIIIVGKRHHTRFYPIDPKDADRQTGNTKPGLVVDRGITNFCNWDFFLQAHKPIKGTAKPAHYYVVYDEVFNELKGTAAADALEKLTHGLCYLFGRATGAVSICPPAYYADLVCERARCYMSPLFAPGAGDTQSVSSAGIPDGGEEVTLHPAVANKMFYI